MPNQTTASDLPFYDNFDPQKVPLSKNFDDVIVRDLWFAPPQSKTWATPMGYGPLAVIMLQHVHCFQRQQQRAKYYPSTVLSQ